jgi:PAS domain S-box-containing protein
LTDPNVAAIVVNYRDITERKRAEEYLRQSEAVYRGLFDNVLDGVYRSTPEGRLLAANPALVRMLGYQTEAELLSLNIQSLYADPLRRAQTTRKLEIHDDIRDEELVLKRQDGQTIVVLENARVVRDEDGRALFYEGTLTDITMRKLAEEALRASEAELRALFAAIPDLILTIDREGRYLRVAPTNSGLLYRPAEDLLGRRFHDVFSRQKADEFLEYVHTALDTQEPVRFEYALLVSDRIVWFSGAAAPLTKDTVVWVARDITSQKEAEENVQRRLTELEALHQSGIALNQSLDPREIGQKVIDVLSEHLNWHHAAVRIRRGDSDEIELLAFSQTGGSEGAGESGRMMALNAISKIGEGMSGWVIEHGDTVNSGKLKDDPRYHETFPGMRSGLYVPILAGGRTLGCISVESIQHEAFTQADERLLTTLASQAAAVIERARLFEETRQRADQFASLYETTRDLTSYQELDLVLQTIVERASQLLHTAIGGIYLYDPARSELEVVVNVGLTSSLHTRLAVGEGVAGRVAQTRQPMAMDDYQTWEGRSRQYEGVPLRAVLGVPMIHGGELIGVLTVDEFGESDRKYTEADARLLSLFASHAASAVQSARLLDQTRRRLQELDAMATVSSALRASGTREEIISIILGQLQAILHADGAFFGALDPVSQEIVVELAEGSLERLKGLVIPPGQGLSAHVVNSRSMYTTPDLRTDPFSYPPGLLEHARCAAVVPLIAQDHMIGVLGITRDEQHTVEPDPFAENETNLLLAVANMAANAIQRVSLYERTSHYADQLVAINDIGRALSETLDPPRIYEKVCRSAVDLFRDTVGVFLSLFDSQAQSITAAYGLNDGEAINVSALPPLPLDPNGNQGRVIVSGMPLVVADLAESLKGRQAVYINGPDPNEQRYPRSALYAPMKVEGRVIGVLQLQSYSLNRYSQTDAQLLGLVANTAAAALQNARLFSQLKRRVDQLSALHNVDAAISSTTDLRVSLQSVLENISRQLKVDAADVLLLNPATLIMRYVAGIGFFTTAITRTALAVGMGSAGVAALERRMIHIPDLKAVDVDLTKSSMVAAERFVSYLAVPLIAKGEVKGVLEIFQRTPLELDEEKRSFLEMLTGQAALAIDNALLFESIEKANVELIMAYDATIEGWSQALELRDQETRGHSVRVLDLTLRLASAIDLSDRDLQDIRRGVLLHDIGKMGIPDAILRKPGALSDEEWDIMRKHPQYAHDMLAPIAYLRNSLDIPYAHHEKWDGTGYPRRLKGETIPLPARIFAVVDVYDALMSDRPYRAAWPKEKTTQYILSESGKHFDPAIVDVFLKLVSE